MIIVLETSGKGDSVDGVKIKLFLNRIDAEKYCIDITNNSINTKYWTYAKIVEEGTQYEVIRGED